MVHNRPGALFLLLRLYLGDDFLDGLPVHPGVLVEGGAEPLCHGGEGGAGVLPSGPPFSGEGGEVHHGGLQVHQVLLLLLQLLHPGLQLLALGGQVGDLGVKGGEDEVEVLGELQAWRVAASAQ